MNRSYEVCLSGHERIDECVFTKEVNVGSVNEFADKSKLRIFFINEDGGKRKTLNENVPKITSKF